MGRKKGRSNSEGTIFEYPEGSGIWWAQLPPDEQRRRPKRRAATQREAREKLRELQRDRERGLNLTAKNPTVAQFLDTWLAEVVKPSVKARTHEGYAEVVRLYLTPHIGAQRLDRLTVASVQRMFNDLQKRVSVQTVHNAYRRLRTALDVAVEWKHVAHNVATAVRLPKIPHTEQRALTVDEARQLLDAVEDHRLAALYYVTLTLGLRKGEVSGLRWIGGILKSVQNGSPTSYT